MEFSDYFHYIPNDEDTQEAQQLLFALQCSPSQPASIVNGDLQAVQYQGEVAKKRRSFGHRAELGLTLLSEADKTGIAILTDDVGHQKQLTTEKISGDNTYRSATVAFSLEGTPSTSYSGPSTPALSVREAWWSRSSAATHPICHNIDLTAASRPASSIYNTPPCSQKLKFKEFKTEKSPLHISPPLSQIDIASTSQRPRFKNRASSSAYQPSSLKSRGSGTSHCTRPKANC
ncbi:hypothetical protein FRC02_007556 [Tulasnella sp. 418]|nr:hypothetical protein FRC02_007556 [Tulasnella sp. 418]